VRDPEPCSVEDLVFSASAAPLLVVLDGIEDPHNVGAILRTVDAVGGDGVVRQSRRAAPLDAAAAKASAGAVAWVRVAEVVNIARTLEELKALNVWTVGLAGDARCDLTVSIPMAGHVESLNVSVAAGVVLFEARRQRRIVPAHPGHLHKFPN
jgi:23S rRNA (guanosine2251-2'-O)-methyltransferase